MKRKIFKLLPITLLLLSGCLTVLMGADNPKATSTQKKLGTKFREVPLGWILDWEEKLANKVMTPSGPDGEPTASFKQVGLTADQLQAAKKLGMKNSVFLAATMDTTEILNKVGMDQVLASIGLSPITFMGSGSISEQVDQINAMASRANEVDFVIAEPYESETTGPAFVELLRSGVPVAFQWGPARGVSNEPNYCGIADADGYGQSAVSAEILAYMMNYKGKVGLIYFALKQWTNVVRYKAVKETFGKYPNIKIVSEKGFTDPNQGRDIALGMLQANPDIDAIWATWMEGPATGAAEAIIELGRVGKVIVAAPDLGGISGTRYIADPNYPIVGTGDSDCIEMGKNAVSAAIQWKLGNQKVKGIYTTAKVYPIVRANLIDGFNKSTRGSLGNLPREVLEMLEKK